MTTSISVNGGVREWRRYPAYKDSGLSTGVQIPSHWSMMRLKYLATVRPSNVDKKTVEGQEAVRLCNYVDVYKNDFITDEFDFMRASATPSQVAAFSLKAGDVIITKDSETWDDIAVPAYVKTDLPGVLCGYHLALVRPRPGVIAGEFLFRAFAAEGICDQFRVAANGITRFGLDTSTLYDAVFPLPPADEQNRIVAFLDQETAKIDTLIAKKERLIELLQEKRTALISRAVTQGLDSSVPMKDLGGEWLGKVPAHWTPKKIKYLFRFAKRQNHPDLTVLSVYRDYGVIVKTTRDDNHNRTPEDLTTYQLVNVGDLVINKMKAWQGSLGISSLHGITSPDYVVYSSLNDEHLPYLHHRLRIPSMAATFHCISNGIRPDQWRLEPDKFEQLWLYLPPVEEQRQICDYIGSQILAIDSLREKVREGIGKLHEYRTALITAAVTGKIAVQEELV